MKVVVDPDRCEANLRCIAAAPDVFEMGDDDQAHVLIEQPSEARRAAVERAVRVCPRQAISITEE
ncbi:MAG: ferredoxin [Dehalococcoidia bacterium]